MSSKKTAFNPDWTNPNLNPQWSPWLENVQSNPFVARCNFCSKTFNLSNMGRQAIKSHETSAKHLKYIGNLQSSSKMSSFFTKNSVDIKDCQTSLLQNALSSPPSVSKSDPSLSNFLTKEKTLEAEILWALKIVSTHSSYNSFDDAANVFQRMFPDSQLAKTVSLGRTKMSYLVSFGLAPYFSEMLFSKLSGEEFVICFDEALNKVSQKGQMDLIIRFWDKIKNEVSTRYFISLFLGHATANDLMEKFLQGTERLNMQKLLQISMDGPNVNLKFLKDIKEKLADDKQCHILDLGSCGLHVVHGALKTGHNAAGWNLNSIFRAFYTLFKDSPARRADFIAITGCTSFPHKFCDVRWLENISVIERLIEIFPYLDKYIKSTQLPETASVETCTNACNDKLFLAKMFFFQSVANVLYPFLKLFQTANPMSPFLYDFLSKILIQLMKKFIKSSVLEKATTTEKYLKIDVSDRNNYCSVVSTDIGIAARCNLTKISISEGQKKDFFRQCQIFLVSVCKKIVERSPLKFPLVRYISCLDPKLVCSNETLCQKRMEKFLKTLYENELLPSIVADQAKQQFDLLLLKAKGEWKTNFSDFSDSDRLDHFYSSLVQHQNESFKSLWRVIKTVLTLSHGNASVESGFSINKDMLVENLHESSLISLRTVYDEIKMSGGILNVPITKELMKYAKSSHSRYHFALEEKKKYKETENNKQNEKRKAMDQIKILKQKKAKLALNAAFEEKQINSQIEELLEKHK